ncbi:hypothetical protein Tco_0347219 [Tanacetum coccineum]
MFDELLTPSPSVDLPAPEVIALIDEVVSPVPAASTGSPSSTTVDQDAPSPIKHMGNDPYFGILIPEISSDQSSLSDSIHTIVHPDHQIFEHDSKWTKDHPLENIIGELDRPVSTWLQLHEQDLFCYYDAFLTAVEPKTFNSCDPVDTPMVEKSKLDEDKEGKVVDPSHYRGMIGTLLYLTASRPDLQFAICMCARTTNEQQQALDDALVPREQRLMIGSCNYILSKTFKPKEPTFQVALDVLSLTPFYPAFLITASVPTIYMQEF